QTSRPRELRMRFTGPEGERIFDSPPLPCNWSSVDAGLQTSGFATLQIGLNLRAMPFARPGVYNAAIYCDDRLLVTYPLSVLHAAPNAP
ncbi:MAG TPA: hypothetical protein VKU00_00195, partial [Chthonomonadaceae bacterium]|nr:hypothetical protein [Chthonomonadaceae bacterium]